MGPEIGIPVTRFRNLPFLRRLEFQPQTNHRRLESRMIIEIREILKAAVAAGQCKQRRTNRGAPPSGLETFFPHLRPLVQ